MRAIPKRKTPPDAYSKWLGKTGDTPEAAPSWTNMEGPVKQVLAAALVEEQGYLCCYCGGRIGRSVTDHHVEHLVPGRTAAAPGALAYANLLASCGPTHRSRDKQHCGEHKADERIPVTPLDADCAEHFLFTADGRILPSLRAPAPAQQTIDILNLKESSLARRRAGAIRALDELNPEELRRFRERCNQVAADGKLREFCFVLAALIGTRLAEAP